MGVVRWRTVMKYSTNTTKVKRFKTSYVDTRLLSGNYRGLSRTLLASVSKSHNLWSTGTMVEPLTALTFQYACLKTTASHCSLQTLTTSN
jgi:hypothetical protein